MFTGSLKRIPLLEHATPWETSWGILSRKKKQHTVAVILHNIQQIPWVLPRALLQLEPGNDPCSGQKPSVENACYLEVVLSSPLIIAWLF